MNVEYEFDDTMYDEENTVRIRITANCPWKGITYRYKTIRVVEANDDSAKIEFEYIVHDGKVNDQEGFESYISKILHKILEESKA